MKNRAEYAKYVNYTTLRIKIPSVVMLKDYVKPQRRVAFTQFNLFLRDKFSGQYCGTPGDQTFDHVVPRASGGVTSWKNVVAACSSCNLKKGSKSFCQLGMNLRKLPRQPGAEALRNMGRRFPPNFLHGRWVDFLYSDAVLDD